MSRARYYRYQGYAVRLLDGALTPVRVAGQLVTAGCYLAPLPRSLRAELREIGEQMEEDGAAKRAAEKVA